MNELRADEQAVLDALEGRRQVGASPDVLQRAERMRALDRFMAVAPGPPVPPALAGLIMAAVRQARVGAVRPTALTIGQALFLFVAGAVMLASTVLGVAVLVGASGFSIPSVLRGVTQLGATAEVIIRSFLNVAGLMLAKPVFWIAVFAALLAFDASLTVVGAVAAPELRRGRTMRTDVLKR